MYLTIQAYGVKHLMADNLFIRLYHLLKSEIKNFLSAKVKDIEIANNKKTILMKV